MSYELRLVHAGHRWDEQEEEELNPGPMVAAKEEEKRRLAGALMRLNPVLHVAAFDYPSLARAEEVEEEEARRRYRHIELNSDDYSGIQITLWDDEAELTFPYWHSGEQARNVLRQAWEYLELLQMWGSFITYDPQLGRVLSLASDFEAALEYLADGSDSTFERAARAVK